MYSDCGVMSHSAAHTAGDSLHRKPAGLRINQKTFLIHRDAPIFLRLASRNWVCEFVNQSIPRSRFSKVFCTNLLGLPTNAGAVNASRAIQPCPCPGYIGALP